jgi:hypothetical protein
VAQDLELDTVRRFRTQPLQALAVLAEANAQHSGNRSIIPARRHAQGLLQAPRRADQRLQGTDVFERPAAALSKRQEALNRYSNSEHRHDEQNDHHELGDHTHLVPQAQ